MKKHKIFVAPTDTIYGILCSAFDKKAVEKIYELKKRNTKKACIILIENKNYLEKFGIKPNEKTQNFLNSVWPGPNSVLLDIPQNHQKKLKYLHRGTKKLAFRVPQKGAIIKKLIKNHGPLIAPSANIEGFPPATTIKEARKYFKNNVAYFPANKKIKGKPSKLFSIDKNGKIKILRK